MVWRNCSAPEMPSVDQISNRKPAVITVQHPLAAAKLAVLRSKHTPRLLFRSAMQELSMLLLMEASRSWETSRVDIEPPLKKSSAEILGCSVTLVPILRAGLGMLDGMLRLLPDALVGHIGIYRDEEMLRPVTYFSRLPTL